MDHLTANIPRLEPNGANWAIFSMRFREAMKVTRHWGYFNGNKPRPVPQDKDKPTDDENLAMETWDYENELACFFLIRSLPDTTAMRLNHFMSAKERWDKVHEEFTAKSTYAPHKVTQKALSS
jgi:hypothetical protein